MKSYSIDTQVLRRVNAFRGERVFTASDFLDIGGRAAIDQALSRHARAGRVHKIARGLYCASRGGGTPPTPSVDAIVKAIKGRDALRLQPAGAYAANLLGLSEQIPMRIVFLTDGVTRRVRVGNLQIVLKRTTPRNMATAGRLSGLVIQALRHTGRRHVDAQLVSRLRGRLSPHDRTRLVRDLRFAPAWIAGIMRQLAARPA